MNLTTPSLFWFVTGVVLLLLEMGVPGFVLFFFAVGAWVTALLSLFLPLGLNGQILVFTVSSVLSLLVLRKFVKRAFAGYALEADRKDSLAEKGERVTVVSDIVPPAEGKVKYSGTTWRAKADVELKAGELAEIVELRGLVMIVTAVSAER